MDVLHGKCRQQKTITEKIEQGKRKEKKLNEKWSKSITYLTLFSVVKISGSDVSAAVAERQGNQSNVSRFKI